MTPGHYVARNLAAALLATSWSDDALLVAAQDYLEASMTIRPALVRLVAQVLAMASRPPTPACGRP